MTDRRKKYEFTQNWFESNIPSWNEQLKGFKPLENHILEIGAFEGASTTWFLDECAKPPKAHVTTIEHFQGGSDLACDFTLVKKRFTKNIQKTGRQKKLTLLEKDSFSALIELNQMKKTFDLIYIDGSHLAKDVLADAVLSWPLLRNKGVMIFDDYGWNYFEEEYHLPRPAIDAFLKVHAPECTVLHHSYQVIIQKQKANLPFTKREIDLQNLSSYEIVLD